MIYLPKRGCFIHIPRAAGNSVTSAIACAATGQQIDVVISTSHEIDRICLSRHAPAGYLCTLIPDWRRIYRFAVIRDDEARFQSVARLIESDIRKGIHEDPRCNPEWRNILTNEEARKAHDDEFRKTTNDWFTLTPKGKGLGVDLIPYSELSERWPGICEKLDIPACELPHLNAG